MQKSSSFSTGPGNEIPVLLTAPTNTDMAWEVPDKDTRLIVHRSPSTEHERGTQVESHLAAGFPTDARAFGKAEGDGENDSK